jgi:hypothetical protein
VGFGGLGWVVPGAGGVVPFFTPGDAAGAASTTSSWGRVWAQAPPRSFANLDYVFVLHGTNDGLGTGGQPPATVASSVAGWLAAVRAAAGPKTAVFLTVPFGGFGGVNPPIGSLQMGFEAYQVIEGVGRVWVGLAGGLVVGGWVSGWVQSRLHGTSRPSYSSCSNVIHRHYACLHLLFEVYLLLHCVVLWCCGVVPLYRCAVVSMCLYQAASADPKTHFLDLGRDAAIGLECTFRSTHDAHYTPAYGSWCGDSFSGCRGIHPLGGTGASARHGELGAMVATKAVMAMMMAERANGNGS